jgi:hypothetical protein
MFWGSDRLLGPIQPQFKRIPVEAKSPWRQNGRDVRPTTHPSIAEITKEWMYTSTHVYTLMTCMENYLIPYYARRGTAFICAQGGWIYIFI